MSIEAQINSNSEQSQPQDEALKEFSATDILDLAEIDRMLADKSAPATHRSELRIWRPYALWEMKLITDPTKLMIEVVNAFQAVEKPENEGQEGMDHLTSMVPDPSKGPDAQSFRFTILKQRYNARCEVPEPRKASGRYSGR